MEQIISYLKNSSFLRHLPEDVLGELVTRMEQISLAKGDVLFAKGEIGDSMYLIHHGWVKIVTQDGDGDEVVLNHCGPGEVVGDLALIDSEPRSAGVVTLSPAVVLELRRADFMGVLESQPRLALDVLRTISNRLRLATAYIEKAIGWSHRIAEGDYHFALNQIQSDRSGVVDPELGTDARAEELLSAFFHMVEGVQQREETLKRQLQQLSIDIDEKERRQVYDTVTQSDFFKELKTSVQQLREQQEREDS